MKTVFVKNNRQYKTTVCATERKSIKQADGSVRVISTVIGTKELGVFSKYIDSGEVIHTGFTQFTEEEYKKFIENSDTFRGYIKTGAFVKYDTPPAAALLDSQLLDNLKTEIDEKDAKIAELEALLVAGGAEKLLESKDAEIKALREELDALKAGATEDSAKDGSDDLDNNLSSTDDQVKMEF